ncbi:MAG: response regulator transcription factor [Actinomycetes bacterium]
MKKAHILVVDDEVGIRDLLTDALSMGEYEVTTAEDGQKAINLLRTHSFDLIIADINMPNMDGYSMLERIRGADDQTPVLILTARNDRKDIATGLRIGADDYVLKPFGLEELMLRVAAILRRTGKGSSEIEQVVCGPIVLNDQFHQVTFNDENIDLSPTEYRLLQYLMERVGKVVRKETLLSAIWGIEFETNTSVVDTYISYLRKKLHRDGFEGIKTVRGVGFQLLAPKE